MNKKNENLLPFYFKFNLKLGGGGGQRSELKQILFFKFKGTKTKWSKLGGKVYNSSFSGNIRNSSRGYNAKY